MSFYRRIHPAGPGWAPIAARAGESRGARAERLAPGLVNWVLGIAVVYSALFALREMLFGTWFAAAGLAGLSVAAGVILSRRLR